MAEPRGRNEVSPSERTPAGTAWRECRTERIVMSPDFAWCLEDHPRDCPYSMLFGAAYMCCRALGQEHVAANGKQAAARGLQGGAPVNLPPPPPVREEARNGK